MTNRKIKIGFFIDDYIPGAGTENQLRGILRSLDPSKIEATLVTLRDPVLPLHRSEIPWPVVCLHVGNILSPSSVWKFAKLVSWLKKQQFDIAMIYFVDTNQFVVPACKLAHIRNIIINRRDMGYWYSRTLLFVLRAVNRMADYFLVNAEAVRELVVAHENFPADRVKVIHNGLWDWKPSEYSKISKTSLGLPSDAPIVGIVASLRVVKRLDRFIEMAGIVLHSVPRAHFLVLGEGKLEITLKSQAREQGLADRVHFLGQVAEVNAYVPLFDVGVLTSDSEGLSNTLMEYAACSIPAVAFDTGGNREVVSDGRTGFLIPDGDIGGMAAKVVAILTDNDLKQQLSEQCTKHVADRFAPKVIIRELMGFFEEIRS